MNNPQEYEELMRRLHYEQSRTNTNSAFTPRQILELSKKHPIVNLLFEKWSMGELTWEQALTGMVVHLCAA